MEWCFSEGVGGGHRWELTVNFPFFSVVMVICRCVDRIEEFSLPPIFCITYIIIKNYYPGKPVNIHIQLFINIIQDKNCLITTKTG